MTFSAAYKALLAFFISTLAGLTSLANTFANLTAVAEETSKEYAEDAAHARAVRAQERQALLNAP